MGHDMAFITLSVVVLLVMAIMDVDLGVGIIRVINTYILGFLVCTVTKEG